jgi:hypothetical protein
MKNRTDSSPRPLLSKDQAGTAINYYAVHNDGFFGSLTLREAAHRPENEQRIRGIC